MSSPIRIVLADDSLVIRRILVQALSRHPDLQVVGVARWGGEAVELVSTVKPDVVLLDVEMPQMNGVEAAERIRKIDDQLPIIMFSSLTSAGASATFDAMARGASDYVTKPRSVVSIAESLDLIDSDLVCKIRFWGEKRSVESTTLTFPDSSSAKVFSNRSILRSARHVEIAVLGVSTGGPNALAELLPQFPAPLPIPLLIVQHMPAVFTQLLAGRLAQLCPWPVREAVDGEPILPGTMLIAPGNRHLMIGDADGEPCVRLTDDLPVNSCRPAVDILFASAAARYGSGTLGMVLTGMGKDGLEGARAIKRSGGQILVQDQATCAVWGMPRAVEEAGLADEVLSLGEMSSVIWRRLSRHRDRVGNP